VPARSADSQHLRQSLGSQNRAGGGGPGAAPRVRFHFTPSRSSWLNEVELWFAKIEPRSSPAASLPPRPIWPASCEATSTLTQPMLSLSIGSTPIITIDGVLSQTSQQILAQHHLCCLHGEKADDQTVAISASTRRTSSGSSNALRGLSRCRTSANNSQTAGSRVARRARAAWDLSRSSKSSGRSPRVWG
jgi:hypothetical protein